MKLFAATTVALMCAGCADYGITTKVSENGQVVMQTGANVQTLDYRSANGSRLVMTGVDHATPIMANAAGTSLIIDATGRVIGVIGAGVVSGLAVGAAPVPAVVATAVPSTVTHVQGVVRPTNINISNQWVDPATGTRVTVRHRKHHHRHVANDAPPKD
jgi:hypothetical protein